MSGLSFSRQPRALKGSEPFTDGHDRLTRETGPSGQIDYGYFANGLRQTQTVLGQPAVNYSYDAGNRPTQISQRQKGL